ncbi:MAG TPA: glycosyltransferase family 2 protein [Methylibium sp.]|uniref:glycosyltransferase family 2 protein n=1 Tax=Methylibium sp. TaxID=2067992 RepID=UPI002DBEADD2|nr:glycosyltransferase family 2 protein [Methylibium sp.]HEU4460746.1 glycosyltransferase family 2 protein [Methylibium sp.]
MPRLRFTVGIPTFNQAAYIGRTIDSLLAQRRPPDEIVVSDHFSTDHTRDVLAGYGSRIRVTQPPAGCDVTTQYSHTLASQSGDWITLLSSDDIALPNFCEVLERGALSSERAVVVRAGWQEIDAEGRLLRKQFMLGVPREEEAPATVLAQRHGPKVSFAAFAIRKSAYDRIAPIHPMESCVERALWLQLAPLGSFVYEPELVSGYRVDHEGDKFRTRLGPWVRDEMRIFYEVLPEAARKVGLADLAWIDAASRHNFVVYLAAACERYAAGERESLLPLLAEWARRTGQQALLAQFADGATIKRPVTLAERTKRLVRPLAQSVHALLHR